MSHKLASLPILRRIIFVVVTMPVAVTRYTAPLPPMALRVYDIQPSTKTLCVCTRRSRSDTVSVQGENRREEVFREFPTFSFPNLDEAASRIRNPVIRERVVSEDTSGHPYVPQAAIRSSNKSEVRCHFRRLSTVTLSNLLSFEFVGLDFEGGNAYRTRSDPMS